MKRILREFSLPFNAIFIYMEIGGNYVLGYAYWFVITKLAGSAVLGTASAMASFSTLLFTIIALGVPLGVTRFFGKTYQQGQYGEFSKFFMASTILVGVSSLIGVILISLLSGYLQELIGLSRIYIYLACVIAFFTSLSYMFRAVFISVQRAQVVPLGVTLGGIARLGAGIGLVLLGWEALGASIGYGALIIVNFILLLSFSFAGPIRLIQSRDYFNIAVVKEVIRSGYVNWLPAIILAVGTQLGTLIVYGTRGAEETGFYFIAYAVSSAICAISSSLWEAMFPLLSGMTDGRKRLTWKGIKLGLVITAPIVVSTFLCSKLILGLFGSEFLVANTALILLLASALFLGIPHGIQTLAYAYGRYRDVLLIGLATNVPRVVLYIVLVPQHGATGAGLAFLGGTLIGLIYSIIVASRIGVTFFWKQISLVLLLPIGIGAAVYFLQLHWILGVCLSLGISFTGYYMLKITTGEEIREIINSMYLKSLLEKAWPFRWFFGGQ